MRESREGGEWMKGNGEGTQSQQRRESRRDRSALWVCECVMYFVDGMAGEGEGMQWMGVDDDDLYYMMMGGIIQITAACTHANSPCFLYPENQKPNIKRPLGSMLTPRLPTPPTFLQSSHIPSSPHTPTPSNNPRQNPPNNQLTIPFPRPPILAPAPRLVARHARDQDGGDEERVQPGHDVRVAAGGAHGEGLHHVTKVVCVSGYAPPTY